MGATLVSYVQAASAITASPNITYVTGCIAIARLTIGGGTNPTAGGIVDGVNPYNVWFLADRTFASSVYGGTGIEIWYCVPGNIGTGPLYAVVGGGSVSYSSAVYAVFSGVAPTTPLDTHTTGIGFISNPSIALAVNFADMVVAAYITNASTPGSWSNMTDILDPGSTYPSLGYADTSSAGTFTETMSGGSGGSYGGVVASFKLLSLPVFNPQVGAFLVGI
jgi:hypothetical protein